ncbi:MAG: PQQ-binding-like beta-propeller repeat protein [Planctomyces sp.]|nr:PQQ-binding-like beta-propeller repeat protein [Planctomyces sp.]
MANRRVIFMRAVSFAGLMVCISVALAANEPTAETAKGEWTQWRGADRMCRLSEPVEWPETLNEGALVQQYQVELQPSYSGPIVTEDKVFVTETVNKEMEVVRALDRATGKELWNVEWPGAMTVPFFAASNGSWIRSTPAWDGERLYVAGMLDVLVALDGATGREAWKVDFAQEFGTGPETFGFVCSPLVDGGHVYVQTAGGLVKLESATGKIVWRSLKEEGGMMGGAFSSPIIAEVAGVRQMLVQTRARLAGVDLETGAELWGVDIPSFRGMNILTPTVLGDRVFTSSYGGGSFLYEIVRSGDGYEVKKVWNTKTEAYMSSPVVINDMIYVHLRNQRFVCINPATGESVWTTKPFGKYWSMVVNGDRMLVLDERGDLMLIKADSAEYQQLDVRHVSDTESWAHLAVAGEQVFVRHLDGLTVYRWSGGK